jgi:excisionase family DNA binding protein
MSALPLASAATHGRPSAPEPVWLTLAQVAQRWQVSIGYVREQARSGRLRSTLVGRHRRVHVSWADAALGLETTNSIRSEATPP